MGFSSKIRWKWKFAVVRRFDVASCAIHECVSDCKLASFLAFDSIDFRVALGIDEQTYA